MTEPPPPSQTPPGWYPDGSGVTRYWDGGAWTEHVAPPPAPGAPGAPQAAALAGNRVPALWWALGAAALMVVGGLGPWATALGVVDVSGTKGDGWIAIFLGALAAAVLWFAKGKAGPVVALIAGAIGLLVAIIDFADISSLGELVDPAWGIFAVIAGSVALGVAAIVLLARPGR